MQQLHKEKTVEKDRTAMPPLSVWWDQYGSLCKKHYLLSRRNLRSSLAQLLMGLAVCLLLLAFQQLANFVLSNSTPHPPTNMLSAPPACVPSQGSVRVNAAGQLSPGCNTILFGPITPSVERLMQRVALNSGLVYGEDVAPFPGISTQDTFDYTLVNATLSNATSCVVGGCSFFNTLDCLPCSFVRDNSTITDWTLNNPNSTQNALFFFGAYVGDTSYAILYNITVTQFPFYQDAHTTSVKLAIDQAIVELMTEDTHPGADVHLNLSVGVRGFPKPVPRLVGYDVFSANGGQWCFVVPCVTFFSMLVDLVYEKEAKLRIGMRQMGLKTSAFWLSWVTYGVIMAVVSTLVLQASGYAIGFSFFTNANFFVTFLMFIMFNISMLSLALFVSTLLTSAKTAQTVGYSMVLIGFVLQFILTSAYAGLVDLLYSDDLANWVKIVRWFLERYPAFNFSKMFYDVSTLAGTTLDPQEGKLISGPGFYWSDMYQTRTRLFAGFTCTLPAPVETLYLQMIDTAIFAVLAFYLDAVLPGPHGSPAHPLFFLGFKFRQTKVSDEQMSALGAIDEAVAQESALAASVVAQPGQPGRIPDNDSVGDVVVRLSRLRVVYRTGFSAALYALLGVDMSKWKCCCGRRVQTSTNDTASGDVVAVKDVSLTVRDHEILVLLGHNGAGKSTIISVLTGLFTASNGKADVYGYDVNTQVSQVQKVMGVCPQHDILWPNLTARETLLLFASVKGLRRSFVESEVKRVLHEVRLSSVCNRVVGGFSGGMKRRLSVAIAALGSPKVIYLDEPTTGMDPVNRLKCWELIQRLKSSSAIVLTTHNMEEANVLGSRVAIMAHGELAALGTPLRLKNAFGEGYRVNLVLRDNLDSTFQSVDKTIRGLCPAAKLSLHDASNVAFTVPFNTMSEVPRLLDWVDANTASTDIGTVAAAADSSPISEYAVSGPTLESVFISVSAASKFDLAESTASGTATGSDDDLEAGDEEERSSLMTAKTKAAVRKTYGIRALLIKNITLIIRQRGLCLCQVVTPLLVLALLVLLQYIIKTEAGSFQSQFIPSLLLPLNMNQLYNVTESIPINRHPVWDPSMLTSQQLMQSMFERVPWKQTASPYESGVAKGASTVRSFVERGHPWVQTGLDIANDMWTGGEPSKAVQQQTVETSVPAFLPPYPPGYDTNCLLFFLYTFSPDSTANVTELWEAVGVQPRVEVPYPHKDHVPRPAASGLGNYSGILGAISSNWCQLKNYSYVNAPFFASRTDMNGAGMDNELMADANILNNASTTVLDYQAPCYDYIIQPDDYQWDCPSYIMPDGTVNFHNAVLPTWNASAGGQRWDMGLAYTLQVNDLPITDYHRPNNFSRLGLPFLPKWLEPQALTIDPARVALMDMLIRGFAETSGVASAVQSMATSPSQLPALDFPAIVAVGTFAQDQLTNLMEFVEIVGAILHPITLTLQLPLFVFVTVLEKEERLVELQRAMGLKYSSYMGVSYFLNLCMYCVVSGAFWLAGHTLKFDFFTETSQALLLVTFFGWGLALCSLATLITTFLWSRKAATVVGYVVALFGNLFAIIIAAGIYGYSLPVSLDQTMPTWLYAFPIFGLVRFIYLGTFNCISKEACYTSFSAAMAPGGEIRNCVGSLYIDAVVYYIFALYLDQVLPRKYGVAKHPLFFLPTRLQRMLGIRNTGHFVQQDAASDTNMLSYVSRWASSLAITNASKDYLKGEDADVQTERALIEDRLWAEALANREKHSKETFEQYPVILRHVRKEFETQGGDRNQWLTKAWQQFTRAAAANKTSALSEPLLGTEDSALDHVAANSAAHSSSALLPSNAVGGKYIEAEQKSLASRGIKVAVSDFSLAISAGTCFGLLGENGAGKSTLIAMLMGLYPPTGGDGLVNGYSISSESDQVRLSIGICMQQDILWENLTIEEHLIFYARVKGVEPAALKSHVHRAMKRVGLAKFASRYAKDLSGGMKRRLSLAIALVGDSRIILADEVTTGLDPSSRRTVWRIIENARKDRVIILVSHDMAEVEVLTNRIGVMTFGRLRCLGEQQHLKSVYGGGYVLSLNHAIGGNEHTTIENIKDFVVEHFPGATVDAQFSGFLAFLLPATQPSGARLQISRVFEVMQQQASSVGIVDWGVGQVSLDTVFQRLVRHYRGDTSKQDDEDDDADGVIAQAADKMAPTFQGLADTQPLSLN